ncbi:MAG TPA: hypothetical protein VG756_22820 [Pseudonocardiaceae bacterium]|jgi:hypothetical protein|nr:hypothetical protein [Pseudonocardiaceae bacterium]
MGTQSAAVVLACGRAAGSKGLSELAERDGIDVFHVAARPGKADVDGLLRELGGRAIVLGTDADLNAVVLRLLRTERLADVALGYVPVSGASEVAATWDLPTDPRRALEAALHGEADRVPLVRDDNGGVLVGLGTIGPVRGVGYCDDTRVLRGPAKLIRVTPLPGAGLQVAVAHRGLVNRREQVTAGRSFEIGCLSTIVTRDGVPHERPQKRWTWYRHTEDLRLVRGV